MLRKKIKSLLSAIHTDYVQYKMVKPFLNKCDDRLSRRIIKTRLNYYSVFLSNYKKILIWIKVPYYRFHKTINKLLDPIYIIEELESITGKTIVIFGQGDDYKYTKSVLNRSDWRNSYRCIGKSLKEIGNVKNNEVLIIASFNKDYNIYNYIKTNYPNINIYEPNPLIWAIIRNQYFDVFAPKEEEYIIDCGAFDGRTEELFFNWGGGHIKKIYAFELDPINKNKCLDLYKEKGLNSIVEFINKGTSNNNKKIYLDETFIGSSASRIGSSGSVEAEIVKIDDEITGKVTFIKMDIEGAELDALHGATKIIQTQKPRLAICLYHKQNDMYEIPLYLLSIVKDYRFIIRHYSSNPWETVLYAYIPEPTKTI